MSEENAKTNTKARAASVSQRLWDFPQLVLSARMAHALKDGRADFPIYREQRFALRTSVEGFFDRLATTLGWRAHRLGMWRLLLDADGLFISGYGSRKADYCSCQFDIWASSIERAAQAHGAILAAASAYRIHEPMFSVDWHFTTCNGLDSATIEELADDVLHDEAYPQLPEGVAGFIDRYLNSREAILVLQGPPGTGKTRLIRAVLGEISRRKGEEGRALYTGDARALEGEEIYVKFITGWDDAFVVEDADHLMHPRADGNEHLHRFLAIADGVVRAQGRKVIFSTNLPNLGDIDEALIRPGRCYARVFLRELTPGEAMALLQTLGASDIDRSARAMAWLVASDRKSHSLAEVYGAYDGAKVVTGAPEACATVSGT